MITVNGIDYEFKRMAKLVEIAGSLIKMPQSNFKHVSFITNKSRILSIGWNDSYKEAVKIGGQYYTYPLRGAHAEANAIGNLDDLNDCRRGTLVNIRLNRHKQLRNSKPCHYCMAILARFGFSRVYYSTDNGFDRIRL